jgi:hypothetical protein
MAGMTFNTILIRVYKDRLRLAESHADTGDANRMKSLSGLRFHTAQSTTNRTAPEGQATHQANEEHGVQMVMRGEIAN